MSVAEWPLGRFGPTIEPEKIPNEMPILIGLETRVQYWGSFFDEVRGIVIVCKNWEALIRKM